MSRFPPLLSFHKMWLPVLDQILNFSCCGDLISYINVYLIFTELNTLPRLQVTHSGAASTAFCERENKKAV